MKKFSGTTKIFFVFYPKVSRYNGRQKLSDVNKETILVVPDDVFMLGI